MTRNSRDLGQPLSQRGSHPSRMKLIDHRYNESSKHLTLTIKFGDAVVIADQLGNQIVNGGSESEQRAAQIWLNHFTARTRKDQTE